MKKYPIGQQDFRGIVADGYLYVDKTRHAYDLITAGKYFFLSRPRRFGKSLLLSTIAEIFSGSKALFEGLWIYHNWDWQQRQPVIQLSFADIGVATLGLENAIYKALAENALRLGLTLTSNGYDQQFKELIQKASVNGKVVVLIDEYDKPIIDHLDEREKAEEHRVILKNFYSVLKGADGFIRFLMLTGVSRFSKVSIFSDLNNLRDITLSAPFAALVGITQTELEVNFAKELSAMQAADADIVEKIKTWYNGYSWDGETKVYNPFSLLNFMADKQFTNFWIKTGTPSFLIKEVRQHPDDFIFDEKEIVVGQEGVDDLFVQAINPVTLMFQTGYLTIKQYDAENQLYTLGYPNIEVKDSVLTHLTAAYSFGETAFVKPTVTGLKMAFLKNDIEKALKIIDTLFVNIPSPLWTGHREAFYHGLIHNTFQLMGISLQSETYNSAGRVDVVVKTPTHIYVLEFKLDKTADEAVQQIFDRDYLRPYQLDGRKKIAVGINFSSEKKAIASYMIKE